MKLKADICDTGESGDLSTVVLYFPNMLLSNEDFFVGFSKPS